MVNGRAQLAPAWRFARVEDDALGITIVRLVVVVHQHRGSLGMEERRALCEIRKGFGLVNAARIRELAVLTNGAAVPSHICWVLVDILGIHHTDMVLIVLFLRRRREALHQLLSHVGLVTEILMLRV